MNIPILLENITAEDRARFMKKVHKTDGCWLWTGGKGNFGHGRFCLNGKMVAAHRFSFIIAGNNLPTELCALHKCDNPPCVRPDHLFSGTKADNNEDTKRKGRHPETIKTHCKHGHEFSLENTIRPTWDPNRRICRTCRDARNRMYQTIKPGQHRSTPV